ncbi:hypothetical protein SD51_11985 [Alicyclobacillus tengchongensis]|nr:hypothetical protein SD51_11985 [Alicyclobacillus tengchongensis]
MVFQVAHVYVKVMLLVRGVGGRENDGLRFVHFGILRVHRMDGPAGPPPWQNLNERRPCRALPLYN